MAVFLAGVGTAEIFKVGKDGQEYLFSTAKTLTESGITIGVSAEDIRAGAGAKLYGKYFHSSTFDLKMTDAMFKLEYIAANVGSEIDLGGEVFYNEQLVSDENGQIELTYTAVPMTCEGIVFAYVKEVNDDYYKTRLVSIDNKITVEKENTTYCVKYLYTNDNAKTLTISANFIPDTLRVYLTMNLFSGDAANPSTGTRVGTVTVMIPRFLLNGTQDLSMSMTGAATTSFEGSALAVEECGAGGCESDGIYAKIIEVIDGYDWRNEVEDIFFNESEYISTNGVVQDSVEIYAIFYQNRFKPRRLTVGIDYKLTTDDENLDVEGNEISGTITEDSAIVTAVGIGNLKRLSTEKTYTKRSSTLGELDYTALDEFLLS